MTEPLMYISNSQLLSLIDQRTEQIRAQLAEALRERDSQREYATLANQKWLEARAKLDCAEGALERLAANDYPTNTTFFDVASDALAKLRNVTKTEKVTILSESPDTPLQYQSSAVVAEVQKLPPAEYQKLQEYSEKKADMSTKPQGIESEAAVLYRLRSHNFLDQSRGFYCGACKTSFPTMGAASSVLCPAQAQTEGDDSTPEDNCPKCGYAYGRRSVFVKHDCVPNAPAKEKE